MGRRRCHRVGLRRPRSRKAVDGRLPTLPRRDRLDVGGCGIQRNRLGRIALDRVQGSIPIECPAGTERELTHADVAVVLARRRPNLQPLPQAASLAADLRPKAYAVEPRGWFDAGHLAHGRQDVHCAAQIPYDVAGFGCAGPARDERHVRGARGHLPFAAAIRQAAKPGTHLPERAIVPEETQRGPFPPSQARPFRVEPADEAIHGGDHVGKVSRVARPLAMRKLVPVGAVGCGLKPRVHSHHRGIEEKRSAPIAANELQRVVADHRRSLGATHEVGFDPVVLKAGVRVAGGGRRVGRQRTASSNAGTTGQVGFPTQLPCSENAVAKPASRTRCPKFRAALGSRPNWT